MKAISEQRTVVSKDAVQGDRKSLWACGPLLLFATGLSQIMSPEAWAGSPGGNTQMSRQELAKALRLRLAEKFIREDQTGRVPNARDSFVRGLKTTSDANVIEGYLKCSVCGQNTMPLRRALQLAEDCGTADEWVSRVAACERFFGGCCHDIVRPN